MNKKLLILSAITAGILFSGCGGSSSSETKTKSISGNVIDPAIKNAAVQLKCENSKIFPSAGLTDETGKFTIKNIPEDFDLSKCMIEASGGQDGGDDLTGLTLKAPYNLYNSGDIYITPFTTAIATHDEYNFNSELAKEEVAKFYGVSKEDLIKDPSSDINLAKITKKITKVALKRDSLDKLTGYIDIDDVKNTTNLNDYINSELVIPDEEKQKLQEEVSMINNSTDIDGLIKDAIKLEVVQHLKKIYKKDSYTAEELANFDTIADTLAEDRKTTIYNEVTTSHIRKALNDLNIVPSFKDDGSLEDSVTAVITKSKADFATYLTEKKIDIKNITGLKLFDSALYEKVLGDDNDARIDYYMFSDKSRVGKAYDLIKDSYSDSLLNPSYLKISQGLTKAGLYDDATNVLFDDIYGEYQQIQAYTSMSNEFRLSGNTLKAEEVLEKAYEKFKEYIKAKGYANLSRSDTGLYSAIVYYYYKLDKKDKAEEVINYYEKEVVPALTDVTSFGIMAVEYRERIFDLLESNQLDDAKYMFDKAVNYVKNVPVTKDTVRSSISNILFIAHLGPIIGKKAETQELLDLIKKIDADYTTGYSQLSAANYKGDIKDYANFAGTMSAITALMGDLDTVKNHLDNGGIKAKVYYKDFGFEIDRDDEETALQSGVIAAYFMAGKDQEGMDLLYKYRPFKDYEADPYNLGNQIYRQYVPRKLSAYLDTTRILKAYDKTVMAKFFETLVKDMETRPWTLDDKAMATYVLDIDYGLPIMMKYYHELNETEKRDAILTKSITLAKAMKEASYKASAYKALIDMVDELKLTKTDEITTLINDYQTIQGDPVFDKTVSQTYFIKYRLTLDTAKKMAEYGNIETAKKHIDAAINSAYAQVDNDLTVIKNRVSLFLGSISGDNYLDFNTSAASALIKVNEVARAEALIDEVSSNIATLGDSVDAYKLYKHVVESYAIMNKYEKVVATLAKIKTIKEKNDATLIAIEQFSKYDAFPNSNVAFVDTDNDGKADFYKKDATKEQIEASGILLDDDIDGDGILDTEDKLPYKVN